MADLIDRDALLQDMELTDAVKYGNKDAEQQYRSYSTWMAYEIADSIRDAPAVNRWIPCSERLPEAGMPVLIYACKHRVTAYYDNCKNLFRLTENDNLYYIAEYVTHWMPLPESPEKE